MFWSYVEPCGKASMILFYIVGFSQWHCRNRAGRYRCGWSYLGKCYFLTLFYNCLHSVTSFQLSVQRDIHELLESSVMPLESHLRGRHLVSQHVWEHLQKMVTQSCKVVAIARGYDALVVLVRYEDTVVILGDEIYSYILSWEMKAPWSRLGIRGINPVTGHVPTHPSPEVSPDLPKP